MGKFKKFINTVFPKFKRGKDDADSVDTSIVSENDGTLVVIPSEVENSEFVKEYTSREQAFLKKEDEDVAVFLSLVDRMSVQSLVFILQGHARSMHNIHQEGLSTTLKQIKKTEKDESISQEVDEFIKEVPSDKQPRKQVVKKLRFAEIMGGKEIRIQIEEIPHYKDLSATEKSDVWWSDVEMNAIKREAARVVHFFRQHRPEYSHSVEILAEAYKPDADDILVEHHLKKLATNSFPRGLECHIVNKISEFRDAGIQAVLGEQKKMRKKQKQRSRRNLDASQDFGTDSQNEMWTTIGKAYEAASIPSATLAVKLAECDHVEALKASISRWSEDSQGVTSASSAISSTGQTKSAPIPVR